MRQYRETKRTATVGAGSTFRVWDDYCSAPFKGVSIYITSMGQPSPAGNLTWSVYYGGHWVGTPFALASTHAGGVLQDTNVIPSTGVEELSHLIYYVSDLLPSNSPNAPTSMLQYSTPIVVEFASAKGVSTTFHVTFVTEMLGD